MISLFVKITGVNDLLLHRKLYPPELYEIQRSTHKGKKNDKRANIQSDSLGINGPRADRVMICNRADVKFRVGKRSSFRHWYRAALMKDKSSSSRKRTTLYLYYKTLALYNVEFLSALPEIY